MIFPSTKFYFHQRVRIKPDSKNFARGSIASVIAKGNRKWFIGPHWYIVASLETGRRFVADECELEAWEAGGDE